MEQYDGGENQMSWNAGETTLHDLCDLIDENSHILVLGNNGHKIIYIGNKHTPEYFGTLEKYRNNEVKRIAPGRYTTEKGVKLPVLRIWVKK